MGILPERFCVKCKKHLPDKRRRNVSLCDACGKYETHIILLKLEEQREEKEAR